MRAECFEKYIAPVLYPRSSSSQTVMKYVYWIFHHSFFIAVTLVLTGNIDLNFQIFSKYI